DAAAVLRARAGPADEIPLTSLGSLTERALIRRELTDSEKPLGAALEVTIRSAVRDEVLGVEGAASTSPYLVTLIQNGRNFFASFMPSCVTAVPETLSLVSFESGLRFARPASVTLVPDRLIPARAGTRASCARPASVTLSLERFTASRRGS